MTYTTRTIVTAIAVLAAAGTAPAVAEEVSKEACIESHSRGQDAKDQGKITLARKLFLSCAQSACPALVQGDCARFADELTRSQPTLNFTARDAAGADLPDTSVYVDGVLIVTRLDGNPHDVDPGAHTVKFIHGSKDQTVTVVVGSGEKGRTVAATFGDPVGVTGTAAVGKTPEKKRSPAVKRPLGAKMMIGAGALLVLGGGTMGVLGIMRVPDNCSLSTHQCAAPPGDPSFSDASSAIQLSNIGWITAGVGVVAVTAGFAWYVGGKKTTKEDNVVAAPWVTSDSAGFAVMGRL